MRTSSIARVLLALTFVLVVAVGCAGQPQAESGNVKLQIGLLPIPDSLPMWVADKEGYFAAEKVSVELVNFASAMERDAGLQAGQLDGELNDLISTGLLNKEQSTAKVVRLAYHGKAGKPMISVIASASGKARTAADLRGGEIALSQNTVIEYVADMLLKQQGINPADVKRTEVPKIPLRLEMLDKGQVAAAGLPEPFATLALQQGGRLLLDDGASGVGQSEIVFRTETLTKKGAAVKGFLKAYERAVTAINANPQKYRDLLVDKAKVPEAVRDAYAVPTIPVAGVPSDGDVKAVFDWMTAKGLITRKIGYAEVVDGSFLPK